LEHRIFVEIAYEFYKNESKYIQAKKYDRREKYVFQTMAQPTIMIKGAGKI
jgi:hypothetical protein